MKKSMLLVAAILLTGLAGFAQSTYNLVVFSEDGLPFYAIVNGIKQNDKPETNVKVTGLNSEVLNLRVEFTDPALPKLKQNMMPEIGFEHTINIKRNVKKVMKLQYFGKVALADAPKSNASTVAYHTSENSNTGSSNAYNTSNTSNQQINTSTSVNDGGSNTSVSSTTTTTTRTNGNPDNVSVNINVGGAGINMNVGGLETQGTMQTTSSTTVTKTSSSSSSSSGTNTTPNKSTVKSNPNPVNDASTQPVSNYGCSTAMSSVNYDKMKKSVEDKPFSDTKMSTAKLATKNNCLSVSQIKGICALFNMDDEKLTYAKYAYDYCVDKGNYYQVSEAFTFSGTTDEFNSFLEGK